MCSSSLRFKKRLFFSINPVLFHFKISRFVYFFQTIKKGENGVDDKQLKTTHRLESGNVYTSSQEKGRKKKDNIVWGLSPERELCWSLVWIRLEPRVKTRPEVYTESAPDRWHSMRSQVGSNSKQLLSLSLGGLASRGERQRATFQRERRAAHRRARLKKRDLPSFFFLPYLLLDYSEQHFIEKRKTIQSVGSQEASGSVARVELPLCCFSATECPSCSIQG